jgi:hypothetical protein
MIQPKKIEQYFHEKNKGITDDFGWTGEFKLTAKDILDFIIDLRMLNTEQNDEPSVATEVK